MIGFVLSLSARPAATPARDARLWCLLIFWCGVVLLLLANPDRMLRDPDTQWHIAVGESIWRDSAVPHTDQFSHTFVGTPWIAKEWLAQVILSRAYAVGGWSGVTLLSAITIATSFSLLLGFLLQRVRTTTALVIALTATMLSMGHFLARPLIFYFLFLVIWVAGLISAVDRRTTPTPWLLPVIILWANLHASFTIAFVVAAFFGLEALTSARPDERRAVIIRWCLFGLAALAGTGITPYGFEPLLITSKIFGGNEAVPYIDEWHAVRFDVSAIIPVATATAAVGALLVSQHKNAARVMLVVFCAFLMFRHVRFGSLFAIVAALSIAGPLAQSFPALIPRGESISASKSPVLALFVACLIVTGVIFAAVIRPTSDPRVTPRAALQTARFLGISEGPVFNQYNLGGYLIHQGIKTFIDGRTDQLFLDGFMKSLYVALLDRETADEFVSILDRHRVTWAIVQPQTAEAAKLRQAEWRLVHQDAMAEVFIRQ